MRYEKPCVIDLSVRARASGDVTLSCYSGTTPGGDWYLCETGGTPFTPVQQCVVGPQPGSGSTYMCISGSSPLSVCASGAGGYHDSTCTVGPSATG